MFATVSFVNRDDIRINPIDNRAERVPASEKLYLLGVEHALRKEEDCRLKRLQEDRELASELQEVPKLNGHSKEINFRNQPNQRKNFYEYNQHWKNKIVAQAQAEKEHADKMQKIEADMEWERIKESRAKYERARSKKALERAEGKIGQVCNHLEPPKPNVPKKSDTLDDGVIPSKSEA